MIAGGLVLLFLLATLVRLLRDFRRGGSRARSPGTPARGWARVLGWTASPLLHAALGILAAGIALREPGAGRPRHEGTRDLPGAPVATLAASREEPVSGERIPDDPRFEHPPASESEKAPEPDRAKGAEPREEPDPAASPRVPEPRALVLDRFRPLPRLPEAARSPGEAAGEKLGFPEAGPVLAGPLLRAARPRSGLGVPRLLPAPRGSSVARLAGPRRAEFGALPSSSVQVGRSPLPARVLPALRVGVTRTWGLLPSAGARSHGAPASFLSRPGSPGSLVLARPGLGGTTFSPGLRAFGEGGNPSAVSGTDVRRPASELSGTTIRLLFQGLSGTDMKGRR